VPQRGVCTESTETRQALHSVCVVRGRLPELEERQAINVREAGPYTQGIDDSLVTQVQSYSAYIEARLRLVMVGSGRV